MRCALHDRSDIFRGIREKSKKKRTRQGLIISLLCACLSIGISAYVGYQLAQIYGREEQAMNSFEELRKEKQSDYDKLKEQNPDCIGWISVKGTNIDFPVMQTAQEGKEDFYLTHDFNKKESAFGTPYVDVECTIGKDNLIIYGHNVRDRQMFGALNDYKEESYAKKHSTMLLELGDDGESYQVIGAFTATVDASKEDAFDYTKGIRFESQEEFEAFEKQYKERAIYVLDEMKQDDELLMLSTCEYTHEEGRMVVIARKVKSKPPAYVPTPKS